MSYSMCKYLLSAWRLRVFDTPSSGFSGEVLRDVSRVMACEPLSVDVKQLLGTLQHSQAMHDAVIHAVKLGAKELPEKEEQTRLAKEEQEAHARRAKEEQEHEARRAKEEQEEHARLAKESENRKLGVH